jgi:hypothetical protein
MRGHGVANICVSHPLILPGNTACRHLPLQRLRDKVVAFVILRRAGVGYTAQQGICRRHQVAKRNRFPDREHSYLGIRRALQKCIGCGGPCKHPLQAGDTQSTMRTWQSAALKPWRKSSSFCGLSSTKASCPSGACPLGIRTPLIPRKAKRATAPRISRVRTRLVMTTLRCYTTKYLAAG